MEPIIFQIIDWIQYNDTDINDLDESDELEKELGIEKELKISKYKIRLYGRNIDNKSVCVNINDYTPFFYVKIPSEWTNSKVLSLVNLIKGKVAKSALSGFKSFDVLERKDLYGFTGYKSFKFLRLIFHNMKSYKSFEYWIQNNKISHTLLSKNIFKLQIYESNIEPFIRCMHIRKLNACGWVKISDYEEYSNSYSHCDIAIQTGWTNLESYDSTTIQKFIVASWDIECMSSSGNFPQAIESEDKKEFNKMINSIKYEINKKYISDGQLIKMLYEDDSLSIQLKKFKDFKFKYLGDSIIQIGTVLSYYGESEPFFKSIITLKGCDKIKGLEDVEIQSYDNEKDVLIAWTKLIQEKDPDVITGWNINGFDFQYLFDRAKRLKIVDKVSRLSRVRDEFTEFKDKTLSSSALGDNILKYYDMGGRIIIDLMKVQQRDSKLDSYKLDFVASTYIKEKMIMCKIGKNKSIIYTSGIYGIKEDDYVNISWDDGLSENKHDTKYKITLLEKVNQEELNKLINIVEQYDKYLEFEFKKPKALFKLEINGQIPSEIFEEGNEDMWHIINNKDSKLYFYFENYTNKYKHNEKTSDENSSNNKNLKWIDIQMDDIKRPIKGNKIFWTHAKDDITPKELFSLYKGTDSDRGIIAKYCIMDCVLVTKLMEKLQVLNNNIGMANVCNVPLNYIFMRGQGVKIFSLVSKKCRELNFLIPKQSPNNKSFKSNNNEHDEDNFDPAHPYKNFKKIKKSNDSDDSDNSDVENVGYEGATVFPPVKGIHYEPIPVLDYASLYPRSMIYINISHECYVNNPQYDNLEDYNYETVTYNNNDGTTTTCRFAKHKDGTSGVLCVILEELLKKRSDTKKLMEKAKEEGNNFLAAIYDGLQLAYKVTANSLYGQVGAPTSPIYMKELAASTTATGRKMLEFSRDFIEGTFGELINFALHDKSKYIETSKEFYKNVPVKKFNEPKQGRITMDDFIDYFYNKVNTLMSSEYKVKPKVIYGDSVTPDTPIILLNKNLNSVEIQYIQNIGSNWTEYNEFKSDIDGLSEKQQDSNINNYLVWTDKGWASINRIIRHKTNKQIYKVITSQGYVKVTSDHSLLDSNCNQIKPTDCIIGQTRLLHNREFEGFKRLYGNESNKYIQYITDKYSCYPDSTGTIEYSFACDYSELNEALSIYYACRSLGYYVQISINKYIDDKKRIFIKSSKVRPANYNDLDIILEINDLGFIDDYVYDLETSVGHFHAGVGSLIVKNTDSVFFTPKIHNIKTKQIKTDRSALKVCIEIGMLAGDTICKILPEPEEQIYEKTLWPFIILTKKRYVGNLYEDDDSHYKQKSMGIVLKRRDNAKIVKIVVGGIVDYILNGKPGETDIVDRNKGAIEYTRTLLKKILRGEYPIDKYIVSKTLRANYADRTRIVHAVLADRIAQRDPGNKPDVNDRIPYVYIVPKGKVTLQGERVEEPKYVMTNNLELDYLFYITNQIMKPASQFLEHIATNPDKLFENYINKEINRRKKLSSVMEYVNPNEIIDNNIQLSITTKILKSEFNTLELEFDSDSDAESKKPPKNIKNNSLVNNQEDNRLINKIKSNNSIKSLTIDL